MVAGLGAVIVSLFYLGQWNQVAFEWFHLYLWQALIILDALVVWLIWLRTLPQAKERRARELAVAQEAAQAVQARKKPEIKYDPLDNPMHVLAFASEDLKHTRDKSLFQFGRKREEKANGKVSTFKFGLGSFRITKKRHRQIISKNDNS